LAGRESETRPVS